MQVRKFQQALRKIGFKQTFSYPDVQGYEKYESPEVGVRVDVQLWAGGTHRVTQAHRGNFPYGIEDSIPSDFTTVEGMLKAIEFETTRYQNGIDRMEHKDFK